MPSFLSWTAPTATVHPRLWINEANGPTLASIRDRVTTGSNRTHRPFWNGTNHDGSSNNPPGGHLINYCNTALNLANTSRPNSYYDSRECEYTGALAFAYLIDGNNGAFADRAIDIALYFAAKNPVPNTHTGRQQLMAMAMVLDWAYGRLTSGQRTTIRTALGADSAAGWVKTFRDIRTDEFLWGESHGDLAAAVFALIAILNDGSGGENTTWAGWMDQMLDQFDDNTNTSFFSVFRHFSNSGEGGTHKGAGQYGYDVRNEEFYTHLVPVLKSGIDIDWLTDEAWWTDMMHWKLWLWRQDRSHHRQGEGHNQALYNKATELHAIQIAASQNNPFGEHCQWLANDISQLQNFGIWGPFQIWNILFKDMSRAAVRPTLSRVGNVEHRRFSNVCCTVARDGWDEAGVSLATFAPKYWVGGHSQRDAGHFSLAVNGRPIFVKHGHYDANNNSTWKDPTQPVSANKTGHRMTYASRVCAHNTIRIKNDGETTSGQIADSFQETLSTSTRFGVRSNNNVLSASDIHNFGDQLWPKNTGATKYQPDSIDNLIGGSPEAKWLFTPEPQAPMAVFQKCVYWLFDLTKHYWSGKLNLWRRHFFWISAGQIPSWNYPIIMIWDDLDVVVNSTNPEKTTVYQLQTRYEPTWSAGTKVLICTDGAGRCFHQTLKPALLTRTSISGFTVDGITYPPFNSSAYDDSREVSGTQTVWRQELSPAVAGSKLEYLNLLFPCPATVTTFPTATLYEDATHVGADINGIMAKIEKGGAPFSAMLGEDEPPVPPSPGLTKVTVPVYQGQQVLSGGSVLTSDWQDVRNSYETQVQLKLVSSGTITTASHVQVQVKSTAVDANFQKPLKSSRVAGEERSASVRLPMGVEYFRVVVTPPVGGSVTFGCEFTKVTTL